MATSRQSAAGYDRVSRAVHWGNAILAAFVVGLGLSITGAPRGGAARDWLLTLHMSFGTVILGLVLFWGGWRMRHPAPPLRPLLSWLEASAARLAQALLYLLFIGMPVSGYVTEMAAGRAVSLFGLVAIPPLLAESGRLAQVALALHLVGQLLIYAVLALHIAGALMHGFVRRDGVLEWMLPPRRAR
jgi:cytochrome b561